MDACPHQIERHINNYCGMGNEVNQIKLKFINAFVIKKKS